MKPERRAVTPEGVFAQALLVLFLLGVAGTPTQAAPPQLSEDASKPLEGVYQTRKRYTVRVLFADADGDRPRTTVFSDESPGGGRVEFTQAQVVSSGNRGEYTITWDIPGLAEGGHKAEFIVTGTDGNTARLRYSFVVENLVTKWVIMGVGLLVGLLFVPFLVYVLARAVNRRGDPSRAARVGLLFGILAGAALFIYLFASFYGLLTYAIGGVAALALLVVVLTRR